jgi:hypothetical protein
MSRLRNLIVLLLSAGLLIQLSACGIGDSRRVSDCSRCRASEHCVYGDGSLYCADPCISHLSCTLDHWCVPLVDEETQDRTRWVCMPEAFYYDYGSVYRSDCGDGGEVCPGQMTCLEDSDAAGVYFCADTCTYDDDCLTGCCADAIGGDAFCAPYYPYCN